MNLWIRCGDADNYNAFGDDFDAAADYLQTLGVIGPLVRRGRYGVCAAGFTDWNYISFYWGDQDAQPERELTHDEIEGLNAYLSNEVIGELYP